MKKIIKNLDNCIGALDRRWERMPLEVQHRFIRRFFAAYVVLTAAVIFKVWQDRIKNQADLVTGHIASPAEMAAKNVPPPAVQPAPKNKSYGRKQ